jgi:hypothetical protein
VASPYLGNTLGPIALITAGIYATNGNKWEDAHRIAAGCIAGDIWALISATIMAHTTLNPDITLFMTLAVMGFLAVMISQNIPKVFFMPAWLAGWAIGMLTMNLDKTTSLTSLTVQIGISMLVGIYYVGALLDKIHRLMNKTGNGEN